MKIVAIVAAVVASSACASGSQPAPAPRSPTASLSTPPEPGPLEAFCRLEEPCVEPTGETVDGCLEDNAALADDACGVETVAMARCADAHAVCVDGEADLVKTSEAALVACRPERARLDACCAAHPESGWCPRGDSPDNDAPESDDP